MNRKHGLVPFIALFLVLMTSCSSVRHLPPGKTMLVKNSVEVNDAKSPDFDNLKSYVRPVTNKKFLDLFRVKTVFYDIGQPSYNKKGETKDNGFKKILRNKLGEPPVLLDSNEITNSVDQLHIVMRQLGYFDNKIGYTVTYKDKKHKRASVTYDVTAGTPYTVSSITYDIPIPEYKKIVVINQKNTLLHEGMQYNENVITEELTRIINLIRNEGYYYVEKSIIKCDVSYDQPDTLGVDPHSVSLEIIVKIPENENASRYLYKYFFNDNYVSHDSRSFGQQNTTFDTTYYKWKFRNDSTDIYFIHPQDEDVDSWKYLNNKTLANAIYSHTGSAYSQLARTKSSRTLTTLDNYEYINITFKENESLIDTLNKIGYLDVIYSMIRKKQHSIGGQIDLRNDKSAISLSYTNRNLFRGAEHLTINVSGGYFYYSLNNLFKKNKTYSYPEFGISATLDFPNRLFLFNRRVSGNSISKSTTLNFGVNYSGLYRRLMYNSALTYKWNPTYYISHSISPIDVSTINNSNKRFARIINYDSYPESFQNRFGKFFMLSFKYSFNYLIPKFIDTRNHNMHLNVNFESSGLFLKGLNALFSPGERWVLSKNRLDSVGYNYTSYEKLEILWNYTYKFNSNNSIAMRADMGVFIPLDKDSYVPFEKGFYMGTSNSMRGWSYRGLGPGSYEHGQDSLYTGDVKLELNIEYRGTLYRSFKYGIFVDAGNIWLAKANDDMPGAEFSPKRFYKELAVDVGVGLRLDFDFFVIRIDYAVPIYDPTRVSQGQLINSSWFKQPHKVKWTNGLKIAIGYAF